MFSDDFYLDALGRQARAVDVASAAHSQDLVQGLDDADSAKLLAFELGAYKTLIERATTVQLIVHAAERAKLLHNR